MDYNATLAKAWSLAIDAAWEEAAWLYQQAVEEREAVTDRCKYSRAVSLGNSAEELAMFNKVLQSRKLPDKIDFKGMSVEASVGSDMFDPTKIDLSRPGDIGKNCFTPDCPIILEEDVIRGPAISPAELRDLLEWEGYDVEYNVDLGNAQVVRLSHEDLEYRVILTHRSCKEQDCNTHIDVHALRRESDGTSSRVRDDRTVRHIMDLIRKDYQEANDRR